MKSQIKTILASLCLTIFFCTEIVAQEPSEKKTAFVPEPVYVSSLIDTVNKVKYRVHIVGHGHTLYSITKAYNVQAKDIIKDSPELEVKIGEAIYMPYERKRSERKTDTFYTGQRPRILLEHKDTDTTEVNIGDTIEGDNDWEFLSYSEAIEEKPIKDSIKISLLMPLYLDDTTNERSYAYLPFLEGVLTAWSQLEEESGIYLKIIDVTDKMSTVDTALNSPWVKNSDVIIAAVYTKVFDSLQRFANALKIPFIHPLTEQDGLAQNNPWYIQCFPSTKTQAKQLAEFVLERFSPFSYNYIVIDDSLPSSMYKSKLLSNILNNDTNIPNISYTHFRTSLIKELQIPEINKPFLFIGQAEKEIDLLNTFIALKGLSYAKNATIIGPSKWMSFNKIDAEYFKKFNYICYRSLYTDNESTLAFEQIYYKYFGTLPSELAYKGYATTSWILKMLIEYNADFMRYITENNEWQTDFPYSMFNWQKRNEGGFENKSLHFLQLQDNQYIKIK